MGGWSENSSSSSRIKCGINSGEDLYTGVLETLDMAICQLFRLFIT